METQRVTRMLDRFKSPEDNNMTSYVLVYYDLSHWYPPTLPFISKGVGLQERSELVTLMILF
jgi:hypothetical protein